MTELSYHENPVSATPLVPIAQPNSTIYMVTTWDRLILSYNGEPEVNPEPFRYFLTQQQAISAVINNKHREPKQIAVIANDTCFVWESIDSWGEPVYVYVWAIAPAGGAA